MKGWPGEPDMEYDVLMADGSARKQRVDDRGWSRRVGADAEGGGGRPGHAGALHRRFRQGWRQEADGQQHGIAVGAHRRGPSDEPGG